MQGEYDEEVAQASGLPADELLVLVNEQLLAGNIRDGETRDQAAQRIVLTILNERYNAELARRRGVQ